MPPHLLVSQSPPLITVTPFQDSGACQPSACCYTTAIGAGAPRLHLFLIGMGIFVSHRGGPGMQANSQGARRIVILGGGFGGVFTAMYLDRLLKSRSDVEIVLVNKENYFVFQPMLPEVISGNIGIMDTVSPIHRLLPRAQLFIRQIQSIDLAAKTVTLAPGFRPRSELLRYDHLVLALGTVTDFRGIPGLHEHALRFKDLADAVELRNHLIHVVEEASIERDREMRSQLLTFVVAGGGFSGVEVAAEMNDFLRRVARQYRLDHSEIRVILVHSGERILEREMPEKLSLYAQRIMQKRGMELMLKSRLKTASPGAAILGDGTRIPTKTLVSTVPSSSNPIIETLPLPKDRGRVRVNQQFEIDGFPDVWAIGDCCVMPAPGGDGFVPPTAQHATRQAKVLAHNIVARMEGRPLRAFTFKGLGKMGSLGSRSAVAELFGRIRLSGFPAWLMWRTVYWMKLPGLDRKIKTGLSWLLDLIIPPDTVQLKMGGGNAVSQLHYEPGEVVFHQGDLGDSLFIIVGGEVEVIHEEGGRLHVLAHLGAGDYFGEMALLRERTRSATVRCTQPTDLLALRQGDFQALVANLPDLKRSFEGVMEKRLTREQLSSDEDLLPPTDIDTVDEVSSLERER